MHFEEFVKGIKLDVNAIREIRNLDSVLDEELLKKLKNHFFEEMKIFYEEIETLSKNLIITKELLFLYVFVFLAIDTYEEYKRSGICKEIYFDTMSDISVWTNNCKRDFKIWGIHEFEWIPKHIKMKIFKLGRLQYEPMEFDRNVRSADIAKIAGNSNDKINEISIKKGDMVLNVHIQQGEPLIYSECKSSYRFAMEFFNYTYETFVCHSWLLNPDLKELLPLHSNIIQFQSDYVVFDIDDSDRQGEERIFGKLQDNPSEYPCDTSLQRKTIDFLQTGKKLGIAYGVFTYTNQ